MKKYLIVLLLAFSVVAKADSATEIVPDKLLVEKAQVLEIVKVGTEVVPGTDTPHSTQTIKVKILEGAEKDKEVTLDNDYIDLKVGEVFYLKHTTGALDGVDYYNVDEPYRLPQVFFLIGLFLAVVLIFGGIQGVRGIVSLVGSFLLILYVLLPGIIHGYSPLLITIVVSSLIIIVGSYVTHGFNKTTTSAVLGMIATVSFTGLLAYWSVHMTRLSGFSSEETTYLNFNTRGSIDILGLLLGGIMIGLLGVLYDVAIGQAISVEELLKIAPHVPKKTIYKRAIRIGREHIGALINTLAIAYVGTSLPLLLFFYQASTESVWITINREIFSTEIVRTMIGSIGLVVAVPITTAVSIWLLTRKNKHSKLVDHSVIADEEHALSHAGHSHAHSHHH